MDVDSHHYEENSVSWVAQTVSTLAEVRAALWPILKPLGTVYTTGAFYFLVPVPPKVSEYPSCTRTEQQFVGIQISLQLQHILYRSLRRRL